MAFNADFLAKRQQTGPKKPEELKVIKDKSKMNLVQTRKDNFNAIKEIICSTAEENYFPDGIFEEFNEKDTILLYSILSLVESLKVNMILKTKEKKFETIDYSQQSIDSFQRLIEVSNMIEKLKKSIDVNYVDCDFKYNDDFLNTFEEKEIDFGTTDENGQLLQRMKAQARGDGQVELSIFKKGKSLADELESRNKSSEELIKERTEEIISYIREYKEQRDELNKIIKEVRERQQKIIKHFNEFKYKKLIQNIKEYNKLKKLEPLNEDEKKISKSLYNSITKKLKDDGILVLNIGQAIPENILDTVIKAKKTKLENDLRETKFIDINGIKIPDNYFDEIYEKFIGIMNETLSQYGQSVREQGILATYTTHNLPDKKEPLSKSLSSVMASSRKGKAKTPEIPVLRRTGRNPRGQAGRRANPAQRRPAAGEKGKGRAQNKDKEVKRSSGFGKL